MDSLFEVLILALAVNALVTAWLYGSLFERPRKVCEQNKETWWGDLLTCSLCLPFHVAFWLAVILWVPAAILPTPWHLIPRAITYILAATTLVHYMQGVLPVTDGDDDGSTESNNDSPKDSDVIP